MNRLPKLFATHGYANSRTPTWVLLYQNRRADHCIAQIPVDAPDAPKRTDRTVQRPARDRRGVETLATYALEWLD